MKILFAFSLLLFASWTSAVASENSIDAQPRSPVEAIDEKASRVAALFLPLEKGDTPGAAVIVVKEGRVLLKAGYGLSNLETRQHITPDTAFLLASVTKQFTAMAIMILAERGKLSYEDPLSKFFPQFPSFAREITVRRLLNHTAGLPEYEGLFLKQRLIDRDWPRSAKSQRSPFEPTSKDVLKLLAEQKKLRFRPGEKFEYSNSNYVVLAQIVEKVSGESFSQFLQRNIFAPLGMKRTLLYDETRFKLSNVATSYILKRGVYQDIDYSPLNLIYGEDNIYTTVEDMARWDRALYTNKLVTAATLREALTPGRLNSGKPTRYGSVDGKLTYYGFGWLIDDDKVYHPGGWLGYRTTILRFPKAGLSVVILSNLATFHPFMIAEKISEIYL